MRSFLFIVSVFLFVTAEIQEKKATNICFLMRGQY